MGTINSEHTELGLLSLVGENNIRLFTDGDKLQIPTSDISAVGDNPNIDVIKGLLKNHKEWLIQAVQDPSVIKQLLGRTQEDLIFMRDQLMHMMDQWDKAEKLYRSIHPDSTCTSGDEGCRDDAVVRCKYCEG